MIHVRSTVPGADTPLADPAPLPIPRRNWIQWLGIAISFAVLIAAVRQIGRLDLHQIWSLVPTTPGFWLVFFAAYFVTPFSEWIIFRRLWRLPASGVLALARKRIGNEILLGYIGEVYFYAWARKRAQLVGAPFGAVKDVAILSALAGNTLTIALMIAAWPLLRWLSLDLHFAMLTTSMAILVGSSAAPLVLRRRLFSLPPRELRFVLVAQSGRVLASAGLAALMWHLVLPQVGYSWWLLLSTVRMILSRLPLIPNKDFVFAGMAVLIVGHDAEIADLIAMIAGLTLAVHLLLGVLLTAGELAQETVGA